MGDSCRKRAFGCSVFIWKNTPAWLQIHQIKYYIAMEILGIYWFGPVTPFCWKAGVYLSRDCILSFLKTKFFHLWASRMRCGYGEWSRAFMFWGSDRLPLFDVGLIQPVSTPTDFSFSAPCHWATLALGATSLEPPCFLPPPAHTHCK